MQQKNNSFKKTLHYIAKYLNSSNNVITTIARIDGYNDYPFFYQYGTSYIPRNGYTENDLNANGISLHKNEAVIKAVMETIERWYLSSYAEKELLFFSYEKMSKKEINVLDPKIFQVISSTQRRTNAYKKFLWNEKSSFYWTKVNKFGTDKTFFIPAQLIYFLHNTKHKGSILRLSDSTGAAAGTSIEQALYKGICELIERDAYAICYYNMLPGKRIRLDEIKDPKIAHIINTLEQNHFDISIFDISLDISIPVFLCLLVDQTNIGPKITVGVKCSFYWQEAMYGAIMESLQGLTSTRDLMQIQSTITKNNFNKISSPVKPILERMLYWANVDSSKDLKFLLSSSYAFDVLSQYPQVDKNLSYKELLKMVVKRLDEQEINTIYWKKVTPQKLDRFYLYGVKVVIPQLQSISLDQKYLYFGSKRVYTVPVKIGLKKTFPKEGELNSIPHPLP